MKAGREGSGPFARHKRLARSDPRCAGLVLLHILWVASAPGAWALQILEATDHAELTAEISSSAVNRIALDHDRVARVIQSPSALTVEHDPVSGDVYLSVDRTAGAPEPVTLYLGSERGFTYRLTLGVAERGASQILIRNAAAVSQTDGRGGSAASGSNAGGRVGELVALIGAVARREPLPGYEIVAGPLAEGETSGSDAIETWRGPRWTARVFAHGSVFAHGNVLANGTVPTHGDVPAGGYVAAHPETEVDDAAALAEAYGPGVAAAWVSRPGPGPGEGRIAVVVEPSPGAGR